MQLPLAQSTTTISKKKAFERQRETPNPASFIYSRARSKTTPWVLSPPVANISNDATATCSKHKAHSRAPHQTREVRRDKRKEPHEPEHGHRGSNSDAAPKSKHRKGGQPMEIQKGHPMDQATKTNTGAPHAPGHKSTQQDTPSNQRGKERKEEPHEPE